MGAGPCRSKIGHASPLPPERTRSAAPCAEERQHGPWTPVIVVRITGGLGNQLFQYALGRRLSLERGEPLKLDASDFEKYTLRRFTLDRLSLQPVLASEQEVRTLTHAAPHFPENIIPRKWIPRALRRRRQDGPHHCRELNYSTFDPQVLATPSPTYLHGYWQSECYFNSIPEVIRREFKVHRPLLERNEEMARIIAACESVSLHVRRGDYASDPQALATLGLCTLQYYATAVAHMLDVLAHPRFFVFSDDPSWAAEHLSLPGASVFVDHNDADSDYEDLRLMGLCRHHIIANSSFSWWGAWLNPDPNKIVVAPRRWMADPTHPCPDVCPPDWRRL